MRLNYLVCKEISSRFYYGARKRIAKVQNQTEAAHYSRAVEIDQVCKQIQTTLTTAPKRYGKTAISPKWRAANTS
ncbi:MAG: hypothetical protein ACJAYW_000193 [Candidatus Azotimanducaceae bacterium]